MKRYLLVAGLIILVGAAIWGLATAGISAGKLASLKARVAFLESAFSASDPQALLQLLDEMDTRLDAIQLGGDWATVRERLDSVLGKVATLEDALGYPVVSAQNAQALIGQEAAVYGVVQRARKSPDGYLFITLEGGFTIAWFDPPDSYPIPPVGAGVVCHGTLTEYRGKAEIIVTSSSDLVVVQ